MPRASVTIRWEPLDPDRADPAPLQITPVGAARDGNTIVTGRIDTTINPGQTLTLDLPEGTYEIRLDRTTITLPIPGWGAWDLPSLIFTGGDVLVWDETAHAWRILAPAQFTQDPTTGTITGPPAADTLTTGA